MDFLLKVPVLIGQTDQSETSVCSDYFCFDMFCLEQRVANPGRTNRLIHPTAVR